MSRLGLLALVAAIVTAGASAHAATFVSSAVDTGIFGSMPAAQSSSNLAAYSYGNGQGYDGFMKFDILNLPSGATLTGATLTLYSKGSQYGAPRSSPSVAVYAVEDDGWAGQLGSPILGNQISNAQTLVGGPYADHTPVIWSLNVNELSGLHSSSDRYLSLAIHNLNQLYSFAYFYKSDAGQSAPMLTLEYTSSPISAVPEPAAWATMIIGFGGAGTAIRRSRRRLTRAPTL